MQTNEDKKRIGKIGVKDILKSMNRKKAAALGLVLLFFLFTATQFKLYKDEILPVKGEQLGEEHDQIVLQDGVSVVQEFRPAAASGNYLDFDIRNPEQQGNQGALWLILYDKEKKLVQKTGVWTAHLKEEQKYRLQLDANLEPGETYKILIRTKDVSFAKKMALVTTKDKSDHFLGLSIDGKKQGDGIRLRARLMHPAWNVKKIAAIVAIFFAVAIIIVIPIKLPDRLNKMAARLLFAIAPMACFVIVEKTCQYRIFSMGRKAMILNLWVYGMVLLLVYLVCNRTRLAAAVTACFSFFMALVNYFVSYFRGTVFVPADITAAGTAANVLNSYAFQITTSVLWGGIGLMCFLTALYKLRPYRGMDIGGRLVTLGLYALMLVAFVNIFYRSNSLEKWKVHYKVWNPMVSYKKNGFAVCFVVGSRYLIPEKPTGYTAKEAAEKAAPYKETAKNQDIGDAKKPNIIAIMDEAFCDLTYDGELAISEDAMPFIRGLKEDTVKGNLHVTSFGGRTANTEYEFLTGMSMAFFPGGTVPYEHQMKHEMDSLTTSLNAQGYGGMIAMHPYKPNGYNRENAYPLLGFTTYLSRTDFENPKILRKYISDRADFEKITELYEAEKKKSDKPFYLFNVTMQNHGGYGEDFDNLPLEITIQDKNKNEGAERYLNLVKKTDEAFEWLINYFKGKKDPTVIVMFGDHQPNLSDDFFASLIGEGIVDKLEGISKDHVVPFVIWANYDIPEEEIEALSVNYLSTKLCEVAGVKKTPFQCFLSEMQKEIPVITGNYYMGKDGVPRELSDKKGYEKWIDTYQYFQYNQVYDYKNVIPAFFSAS